MADIRSSGITGANANQENYLERVRESIGEGFTGKMGEKKKGRNEMGKDDFMKLMTAQLKYQDPISPVKNEQMAAQLAQFSSLEQMVNMNSNIEKMANNQKPQERVLASSLIGKSIVGDSSKFNYTKDEAAQLSFELPQDAANLKVTMLNSNGDSLKEILLGQGKKGLQKFRWDGSVDKGEAAKTGQYSFRVEAKDADGKPIQVKNDKVGLVTGVTFEGGKTYLTVGDKKVSIDEIDRIETGSASPAPTGATLPAKSTAAQENEGAAGATPQMPAALAAMLSKIGGGSSGANAGSEPTGTEKSNAVDKSEQKISARDPLAPMDFGDNPLDVEDYSEDSALLENDADDNINKDSL